MLSFIQPTSDQFAGFIEGDPAPLHQIIRRAQALAVQHLLFDIVGRSGGLLRGHDLAIIAPRFSLISIKDGQRQIDRAGHDSAPTAIIERMGRALGDSFRPE